jgi:hypothetical protein
MRASEDTPTGSPKPPEPGSTVILLLATIGDTTWRMFVPTLGGTGLGLWADSQWHTQPWLSITGLGVGIVITVFLMIDQFKKVNKS